MPAVLAARWWAQRSAATNVAAATPHVSPTTVRANTARRARGNDGPFMRIAASATRTAAAPESLAAPGAARAGGDEGPPSSGPTGAGTPAVSASTSAARADSII